MSTTTCPSCGSTVRAGLVFCSNCGVRLDSASSPPDTQPQSPSAAPTAPGPAPTPSDRPSDDILINDPYYKARAGQWRVVALAAVFAVVVGSIAAFMWPAEAAGELVADTSIGPSGGTVPITDGGRIDVPQGAMSDTERITVRKTPTREPARIGDNTYPAGALWVYIFGPANIDFSRPVTVVLPLPADAIAGRIFVIRDGTLTLLTVLPNEGGNVTIVIAGFNNGRLVLST